MDLRGVRMDRRSFCVSCLSSSVVRSVDLGALGCEKRYESEFLLHDFFAKQEHPGSISWTLIFGFMEASRLLNADCANSESLCENLADKLQLTTWQVGNSHFQTSCFCSRWLRTFVGGEINSNYGWMATNLLRPSAFCKVQNMFDFSFWEGSEYPDSLSVTLIQDHLFQQVFELFVFTSKFRQARFAKDLSWNCHLSLVLVNSENCVGEHFGAVLLMVHSGGPKKSWQIPHTATYTTVSLKLILSQPRQPTLFQTRIALNCKIKDKARNQHKIQAKVKHKSQVKTLPRIKQQANQNTTSTPTEISRWILFDNRYCAVYWPVWKF